MKKVAVAIGFSAPASSGSGGSSRGGGGGGSSAGRPSATRSPASAHSSPTLSTAQVPINFTKMAPASPLRDAPTVTGPGIVGSTLSSVFHSMKSVATGVGKTLVAAAGGCASSMVAFASGAMLIAAAASEGFLAEVGVSCVFGAIDGGLSYLTGGGSSMSAMDDFRQGLEFGLYHP